MASSISIEGVGSRLLLGVIALHVILGSYLLIGHNVTALDLSLITPIDRLIPFVPWTGWFYVPTYSIIFLIPIFLMADRKAYHDMLKALVICSLLAFTIFLLVPMEVQRPPSPQDLGFGAAVVRWVHSIDAPTNSFPSLHIALAITATCAIWRWNKWFGLVSILLTVFACVSVLTTHQHYIADIFGAIFIAAFSWRILATYDRLKLKVANLNWSSIE